MFCAEKRWGTLSNDIRLQGYREAMEENDLSPDLEAFEYSLSMEEGLSSLRKFLEAHSDATALICISDESHGHTARYKSYLTRVTFCNAG